MKFLELVIGTNGIGATVGVGIGVAVGVGGIVTWIGLFVGNGISIPRRYLLGTFDA